MAISIRHYFITSYSSIECVPYDNLKPNSNHNNSFPQPKLIASNDYPVERHQVTTRDDYILQMHRIPAGRRSPRKTAEQQSKGKNALLLIHGLFGSSGDFITMGRKKSLGSYSVQSIQTSFLFYFMCDNRTPGGFAHNYWSKK